MSSTAMLRSGVADLAALAEVDLAALWAQIGNAADARDALADILPLLIDTYGAAAATLAADWYDDLRDEAEVRGRFTAITAEITDGSGAAALAGWATSPLLQPEPDWDAALRLVTGGMQRRIANASRETITFSAIQDPAARGWQRTGTGSCAFCAMLIGRGAIYTDRSADFGSHDHCNCNAIPAWGGKPAPVKAYVPTNQTITDADRARVREWIAANQ